MSRLTWGDPGTKFFETGIDRGVLYVDSAGYAWNGLTAVTESPTGGEPKPFYADGLKYLNLSSAEEFEANIEAFGAPDAFGSCDGRVAVYNGLFVGQQPRKAFSMAYRTLVGNDTLSKNYGYKIHLIWNALAAPTERAYTTNNESPEGVGMSWSITTLPPSMTGYKPTAYMEIDSRFTPKGLLKAVEDILFGSDAADARMPFQSELAQMFKSEGPTMRRNYAPNPSFRALSSTVEVYRNFIKNPSFRTTNGLVEVRRNLALNPGAEAATSWPANNGASHTMSLDTTFFASGSQSSKSTPTASTIGASRVFMSLYDVGGHNIPASATKIYTVSTNVATNAAGSSEANLYVQFLDSAGAILSSPGSNVFVPIASGQVWTRVSYTTPAAPTNTAYIRVMLTMQKTSASGLVLANEVGWADECLVEESTVLAPYFSGRTVASGDFQYAWVGTPDASASIQRGVLVDNLSVGGNASLIQSTAWTRPNRTYSLRMASQYFAPGSGYIDIATLVGGAVLLVPGKTYTIGGWFYSPTTNPNTTASLFIVYTGVAGNASKVVSAGGGEQRLQLTFTVPTDAAMTGAYVRIYNGGVKNGPDVWISDLTLVEGTVLPPFFDGNTPAADGLTYSWSGTANASAPIATGVRVSNWSNGSTGKAFYRTGTADDQGGYYAEIRDTAISYMAAAAPGNVGEYWAARLTLAPAPDTPAGSQVRVTIHDGTGYATTLDPNGGADGYITVPSVPTEVIAYSKTPLVNTSPRLYVYPLNNIPVRVAKAILEKVDGPGMAPGPFFDGSSPNGGAYFYHWDAVADLSTSYVNTWN